MPVLNFGGQKYVEPGTVLMWAGQISNIPAGWAICDGNNGTPDFTGKFIRATPNVSDVPGSTGGTNSYTLSESQLPSHSHGGSTGNTDIGKHQHDHGSSTSEDDDSGDPDFNTVDNDTSLDANSSSTSGSHSHSTSMDSSGGSSSVNNLPKYYELAYIQKL